MKRLIQNEGVTRLVYRLECDKCRAEFEMESFDFKWLGYDNFVWGCPVCGKTHYPKLKYLNRHQVAVHPGYTYEEIEKLELA